VEGRLSSEGLGLAALAEVLAPRYDVYSHTAPYTS
jgi:hypothetical protein